MKGFLRKLLASLALACALVPVFAGTAWAEKVDVSLSALSAEGELTGGCVGFSPDERFRFAHSSLDDRESFTVYAVPDEGYEFVMWVHLGTDMTVASTAPTYTLNPSSLMRLGHPTLYAFFRPQGSSQEVVPFASTNGSSYITNLFFVEHGESLILPLNTYTNGSDKRRDDIVFLGWDAGQPGETVIPQSGSVIRAQWTQYEVGSYRTISFNRGGGYGYMDSVSVLPGSTYVLPECLFCREDMIFDRWNLGNPGDTIVVDENLSLVPEWKEAEPGAAFSLSLKGQAEYTLFNAGSGYSYYFSRYDTDYANPGPVFPIDRTLLLAPGQYVQLELLDWERSDCRVVGCVGIDKDDIQISARDLHHIVVFRMPAEDVSLTLEQVPGERSIVFDANGGSGKMPTMLVRTDVAFVAPECEFSAPEGMVFDCWRYFDWDWETCKEGEECSITNSVTFVAQWKDASECEHPTLTAVDGIDATCEAPGQESYWKCTLCGKLFSDADGTHEITAPVEIPAGHDWDEWTVTKEPTATEEGEKTRICKRDSSHIETEAIPVVKTPGEYSPAYGADATWSADDGEGLTFIIKRGLDDDTTYTHFLGASVDGASVPPLGYEASPGSLELTLKPAFLASLAPGAHTLTVTFDDGSVDVAFTTAPASGGGGDVSPAPAKSGLPTWAWILIGVGALAAVAAAALAVLRLRAKRQAAAMRHTVGARAASGSHAATGSHSAGSTTRRDDATLTDHYRRR